MNYTMEKSFIVGEEKKRILSILKTRLKEKFGDNIQNIILFGSQSTGKATKDSDYDILIILREDYDWRYARSIRNECYDIAIDEAIFFDINLLSGNEVKNSLRGKQPIFENAMEKGIYL